tara:strand:- start:241 stop:465 length:225 start_codon:yes stop_codon:yes gene_type:complete
MEMLFHAKWNLPKAARNANLTDKEMKITFNEYCAFHPPTWESDGSVAESVDAPDLKSVEGKLREGSSPSSPTYE